MRECHPLGITGMAKGTASLGTAAPAHGLRGGVPLGQEPLVTPGDTPSVPRRVARDRRDARERRDTGDKL